MAIQPRPFWALSSKTAFLAGVKALNGGKINKSMVVDHFYKILKKGDR